MSAKFVRSLKMFLKSGPWLIGHTDVLQLNCWTIVILMPLGTGADLGQNHK